MSNSLTGRCLCLLLLPSDRAACSAALWRMPVLDVGCRRSFNLSCFACGRPPVLCRTLISLQEKAETEDVVKKVWAAYIGVPVLPRSLHWMFSWQIKETHKEGWLMKEDPTTKTWRRFVCKRCLVSARHLLFLHPVVLHVRRLPNHGAPCSLLVLHSLTQRPPCQGRFR